MSAACLSSRIIILAQFFSVFCDPVEISTKIPNITLFSPETSTNEPDTTNVTQEILNVTEINIIKNIWKEPKVVDDLVSVPQFNTGDLAQPTHFKWRVAVKSTRGNYSVFCGGALVSPNVVLTAATCVKDKRRRGKLFGSVEVHMGGSDKSDPFRRLTVDRRKIKVHPSFSSNFTSLEGNIAVIKFAEAIKFSNFVGPIDLAKSLSANYSSEIRVAGFGRNGTKLKYLKLSMNKPYECLHTFGPHVCRKSIFTTSSGRANESNCMVETGAPISEHWLERKEKKTHLIGLTSFTDAECTIGGQTYIPAFYDWILSNM